MDRRRFLALASGAGAAAVLGGCGTGSPQQRRAQRAPTAGGAAKAPPRSGPKTLAEAIRGPVLRPGAAGYAAAAHVFNERFDHVRPHAVAFPLDAADLRAAIRFTTGHGIRVRARSGGHSYAGYSTLRDGVVIDLRRLAGISVDKRARTATIGAGAQLIDVASALSRHGAMLPSGSCPSVGIAGVTLGGGFGLAARRFGLTTDNLLSARVVTADGALRTVDRRHDSDLLWALRGGGGGNFGVVAEFTFRTHPLPASGAFFSVAWPWSSAAEAVEAWQRWAPHAPDTVGSILHLNAGGEPSITTDGQYLGSASQLRQLLAPLLSVTGARLTAASEMAYLPLQMVLAGCEGRSSAACHTVGTAPGGTLPRMSFNAKSDYVAHPLSAKGAAALVAAAEASGSPGAILCDAYGGAVGQLAPDATAFVHREQLFCIQYYGDGASAGWIDRAWRKMRPYVSGQAYQNYIDPALDGWAKAYYGANLSRLRAVRERVDPHRYFAFPQAI